MATVRDYRVLPESVTGVAAASIIALELLAILGLVAGRAQGTALAAGLLVAYSFAIGANLIRGRRDIDCGCSGPAMRQTLSGWLLVRNLGLIAFALLMLLPAGTRSLTGLDWFTTAAALVVFGLLYYGADRLAVSAKRLTH